MKPQQSSSYIMSLHSLAQEAETVCMRIRDLQSVTYVADQKRVIDDGITNALKGCHMYTL